MVSLKTDAFKLLLAYFIWTILVNSGWSLWYHDAIFLYNSFFYLGIYIFLCSISVFLKKDFIWILKKTGYAILFSLCLVLLSSFVAEEHYWRHNIFFSEINKLSRFVLFSTSILFLLIYKGLVKSIFWALAIGVSAYLILITYSKAAIISLIFLVLISFYHNWRSTSMGTILAGILLLSLPTIGSTDENKDVTIVSQIENRMLETGRYDNLWSRGYDRIFNFPTHTIVGAGEQYRKRFDNNNYEVHSTIANILFSYGVVGLIIMTMFLRKFIKFELRFELLIFVPFFLHSLVHNDIRSIFLWLFISIFSFVSRDNNTFVNHNKLST